MRGYGGDGGGQSFHIRAEIAGAAGNGAQCAAVVAGIETIFSEKGSDGENLVSGVKHCMEEGVHDTGRAAAEHDVAGIKLRLPLGAQPCRQLLAGPAESAVGHVAEYPGFGKSTGQLFHGLSRFGGRGKIGIPETEIAYGVGAVFFAKLYPGFKHAADHGPLGKILLHGGTDDGSGHGMLLC